MKGAKRGVKTDYYNKTIIKIMKSKSQVRCSRGNQCALGNVPLILQ